MHKVKRRVILAPQTSPTREPLKSPNLRVQTKSISVSTKMKITALLHYLILSAQVTPNTLYLT